MAWHRILRSNTSISQQRSLAAYTELLVEADRLSQEIEDLRDACAALSELKTLCDMKTRELKEVESTRPHATFPGAFLSAVLTGPQIYERCLSECLVPFDSQLVIGANRKGYLYDNTINLDAFVANNQELRDYAGQSYYRVGSLPLYYAEEGKNRVEVFRRMNQSIVGNYGKCLFSRPEDVTIHPVNRRYALLHDNFGCRVILFPQITEKIMLHYGARKEPVPKRWSLDRIRFREEFREGVLTIFPF